MDEESLITCLGFGMTMKIHTQGKKLSEFETRLLMKTEKSSDGILETNS
ncbi:hypothetical protein HMPREF1043_1774 [Streptococcus anginosus subsp. whileyi CCUG 39159]|uniref:Uncharacterized protein n=1 Tax=Streptococcus anginosus subsp. whileyi CCUG 39159 TaxID=1095729 RepID=I0SEH5_STRAP|nr:hypothetical protein HMPREF1043_1774 [Streptococcus anginosus subsp. whileyi CCUG 39159]